MLRVYHRMDHKIKYNIKAKKNQKHNYLNKTKITLHNSYTKLLNLTVFNS
jgi:hypothetical protein